MLPLHIHLAYLLKRERYLMYNNWIFKNIQILMLTLPELVGIL